MARRVVASVAVEGFGVCGNPVVLRLGGRGPVAIVGDNGTGKSTLASKALVWCLFGRAAPERMGAATQAIKGKAVIGDGCKQARVTVKVWDLTTREVWTVERTRGRTGGDKVVVLSSAQGSLVEDDIPRIVGCTYEVFVRTVVRGQGDVWAFAESTDARKREILDEVSGASVLAPYHERARTSLGTARAYAAQLVAQDDALRARAAVAVQRVVTLERQHGDWDRSRAADLERRRANVSALEAAEQAAAQADADAAASEAARTALERAAPMLDLTPYQAAERGFAAALGAARARRGAAEAAWLAVRDLAPGRSCPTCAQTIAPTAPVAVARAAAEGPYNEALRAETEAANVLHAAQSTTASAQAWLVQARHAHAAQLAALPPRRLAGALAAAQATTRGEREALALAEKAANPYTSGVEEARAEVARLERDLAVLAETAVLAKERVRLAEAALEALSPKGARASLAEATLAAIEVEANRWLDSLSQGRMSLHFQRAENVERIDTVVRVVDRTTGAWTERDLLQFSGGERARINLACDLGVAAAFDAAGTAVSLLVLDEAVFSGLDSAGQGAIVQLIHAAGVADVVVVDHSPALAGSLPRAIRATIGSDGYTVLSEVACP